LRDHPGDDVAAEDIEEDVEGQVGPLLRALELGDGPRPDLVGCGGQELRLGVVRVAELVSPLAHLAGGVEDAVHGAHGAWASVDRSKPASRGRVKSGQLSWAQDAVVYLAAASSRKLSPRSLVRQLRGPHLST